jgi:hypothetical protein
MSVGEKNSWKHWDLAFTSPQHQVLQPGVYKMAARYPFNDKMPGLSISGHGRGCNTLIGEFEILEVKRHENGEIESFAANFIQRCEKSMPPLFGSIRYNSTIPVEARFSEYFAKTADFTVYLTKYNPITEEKSQPILISKDADSDCELRKLAYGGEGIEISISDKDNSAWTLAFAVPLDEKFSTGTYENAARYPFHSPSVPGIDITTPEGSFLQSQGAFKVLKLVRGGDGEIQSLALNFQVKNSQGEILEGAVRFKSKVPVNLDKPYN